MMLLYTEVDEVKNAYFDGESWERIGSEFADIFIRLLDDSQRFGVRLSSAVRNYPVDYDMGEFQEMYDFHRIAGQLGSVIVKAVEAYRNHGFSTTSAPRREVVFVGTEITRQFAALYQYISVITDYLCVDLDEAYEKKMAINWERDHRHGGKVI